MLIHLSDLAPVLKRIRDWAVLVFLSVQIYGTAAPAEHVSPTNAPGRDLQSETATNTGSVCFPRILLDTGGLPIVGRERISALMTVTNPQRIKAGREIESASNHRVGIAVRGSGSMTFPKTSFRVELWDKEARDTKVSLLGLPAESDWILLAAYADRTLMRDVLAYELWRQLGYYAPRWRHVELFIRTNAASRPQPDPLLQGKDADQRTTLETTEMGDYAGIYILVEKIKRGTKRLDIKKLKPEHNREPELTGGYIFKKDRGNPGEQGFRSPRGIQFAYEEPKERKITPAQVNYLTNYIRELEEVLFSRRFQDPTNGYAKYIDVDSFIDYHWVIEVTKNVDAHWFSQFFYKDRGGKLKAGPVWDWDMGFGNAAFHQGTRTNGWRWEQVKGAYYAWYDRLFEDEEFLQRYIDRWAELRQTVFANSNVLARIDDLAGELDSAATRNHALWYPSRNAAERNRAAGRQFQNAVRIMREWIEGRLAWIDSQDFPPPVTQIVRDPTNASSKLALTGQTGKIHFTTDGSDPRLRGGAVSPSAKRYVEPIPLATNTVIAARVRSDYGLWSAPLKVNGNDVGQE